MSTKRTDHDFNDIIGTNFLEWLGCVPDTSDAEYGHGPLAFSSPGVAAPACVDSAGGAVKGFIHRDPYNADVNVEAGFQVVTSQQFQVFPTGGTAMAWHLCDGVLARIQSGTILGDTTDDIRLTNPDGYMMLAHIQDANREPPGDPSTRDIRLYLELYRLNLGTPTLLAQTPATFLVHTTTEPYSLRLECNGDNLRGFLSLSRFNEVQVFNVTDGSPILTGGRCGFLLSEPRIETFAQTGQNIGPATDVCHYVEVQDNATPTTIYVRDDWSDAINRNGYPLSAANALGNTGRLSPGSAMAWDQFSATPRVSVVANQISFSTSAGVETTVAMFRRPAVDNRLQRRSVKLTMGVGAHDDSAMGIGLRLSMSTISDPGGPIHTSANVSGYVAVAGHDTANYYVRIYRYNGGNPATPTLLAKLEQASPLFTLGSQFTFDFQVVPLTLQNNAPAVLEVRMDTGTGLGTVALVAEPVPGVSDDGNGVIFDGTNEVVQFGRGEAIYAASDNAAAQGLQADDWTEEVPSSPPVPQGTPISDLANVDLLTEQDIAAAKSGLKLNDFIPSSFSFNVERLDPRRSTPMGAYAQSSPRFGSGPRRIFRFTGNVNTQHELKLLEGFVDEHDGLERAFDFDLPDGSSVVATFLPDSYKANKVGPNAWRPTIAILEIFE